MIRSEIKSGLLSGIFCGLGCAIPLAFAVFIGVWIATTGERKELKDGGFTITVGNPKKGDPWKGKLPDGATNIIEKGDKWITFEWEGRKFLLHDGMDNYMTELSE